MASCLFFEISEQSESEQTAETARLLLRDLLNERAGIVQGTSMQVSERAAGANDSVDIAPGGLFLPGTESGTQGFYYIVNETVTNLQMAEPANATLPRVDTIVVYINDAFYSGSVYECVFEWVVGTADADPDPPDLDALGFENYWRLADIDVPADDNVVIDSEISDTRTLGSLTPAQGYATALGGVGVATSTTLNILFPNPREGQHVWLEDDKTVVLWSGADNDWLPAAQQHEVPTASAFRTGSQTIPDTTVTVFQINTTNYDNDGMVSLASNRFIAQTAGIYYVESAMTRDAGFDSIPLVSLSLRKNGVQLPGINDTRESTTIFGGSWQVSTSLEMNVGDFVDAIVFHTGSSASRLFRHRQFNMTYQARIPT